MRAATNVKAVLCTSAAVLALSWFGLAAMAQAETTEDPDMAIVEDGGSLSDDVIDLTEVGDPVEGSDDSVCDGCELYTTFVVETEDDGAVFTDDVVIDDETMMATGDMDPGEGIDGADGEIVFDGEITDEDASGIADSGAGSGEGEAGEDIVVTCDECDMETMDSVPPVKLTAISEVQRNNAAEVPVVAGNGSENPNDLVSRNSSNACDSGWLSTAWICTVQGNSWRD